MNKPRIFISTVTREFKTTRQRIAAILIRKGYEPEWQDIFGTEPGDLRAMLRAKVASCAGLIQIVGEAYGAEPPEPDAQFGRCSYTQFEFLHARALGKKTWLLFAEGACQRDTDPDLLDLPLDTAGKVDTTHPDPAAFRAERRQLQRDYRQRPEVQQHLRHTAESDLALDLAIERMEDDLDKLRLEFRGWQRSVLRLAAAVLLLTALVLGTLWWMKKESAKGLGAVVAGQKEILAGQKLDPARLRAQLLESSERRLEADLADAQKATSADKRQQLRETAAAAHESRSARIADIVARFAELEGRADTTHASRELARILADEGVDAALAYVEREKAAILAQVDTQLASERDRMRARLAPLLSAADLQATKGQPAAARTAYRELLQRDPAWPAALRAFAWFLFDQSSQSERHGSLTAALADAEEAHSLATRLHTADPAIHMRINNRTY